MKSIALLALLLTACGPYHGHPLTEAEQGAVSDAIARWDASGLDSIGAECMTERARARLLIVETQDEMSAWTGYCGPGDAGDWLGCKWGRADSAYIHTGPLWDEVPLYVVWHEVAVEAALAHEAVHWLQECTGRGYSGQADRHADPLVWCPSGCPGIW